MHLSNEIKQHYEIFAQSNILITVHHNIKMYYVTITSHYNASQQKYNKVYVDQTYKNLYIYVKKKSKIIQYDLFQSDSTILSCISGQLYPRQYKNPKTPEQQYLLLYNSFILLFYFYPPYLSKIFYFNYKIYFILNQSIK